MKTIFENNGGTYTQSGEFNVKVMFHKQDTETLFIICHQLLSYHENKH